MAFITIVTATYNRINLLKRAYESLCRQEDKNFKWIIVDDGSTDETKEEVKRWIESHKIEIEYIYQKNRGMTIARYVGFLHTDTKWVANLDSDDYFTDDFIKELWLIIQKNSVLDERFGGFLFPIIGKQNSDLKEGYYSLTEQYFKFGCIGEYQIIFQTEIITRFACPHFPKETFVEEIVYLRQMDQYFKYICLNKRFLFREYLEDGVTLNPERRIINNPKGYAYALKVSCSYDGRGVSLKRRAQIYSDYLRYCQNRLDSKGENLFPELYVPKMVRLLAKYVFDQTGFLYYLKCKYLYPFPKNKIVKGSKIILWGCGIMGQSFYGYLRKSKYCKVILWVDSNYVMKQAFGFDVKRIEEIESFSAEDYDYVCVAILSEIEKNNVKEKLLKMGIPSSKIVLK